MWELVLGIGIGVVLTLLAVAIVRPSYTREVRKDAAVRSRAVNRGQAFEQLAPYLPGFEFNPKDAQFLGKPVDFVVFDGLDEGELRRIVFVEVKTGGAKLTRREQQIRHVVSRGAIEWRELRLSLMANLE